MCIRDRSKLAYGASSNRCTGISDGDASASVRRRAVRELGWGADQNSLAELLKAAEDNDPRVRIAAHSALVRLKGVDVEKLKSIHTAWSKKSEYRNANKDLTRTIAVIKHAAKS